MRVPEFGDLGLEEKSLGLGSLLLLPLPLQLLLNLLHLQPIDAAQLLPDFDKRVVCVCACVCVCV